MTTRETARYRHQLPQPGTEPFLSDGGLETTLIFNEKVDLPLFASFTLLADEAGREHLRRYFRTYIDIARTHGRGIVLESPTWRANADWGAKLGYDAAALAAANRDAIRLMVELREELETPATPIVISGNVGPRGDGYIAAARMDIAEADRYHSAQIGVFADTAADMIAAFTMNYVEEAAGMALAARRSGMPLALSFTLETDGKLPSGQPLDAAIARVDEVSGNHPAYYMINCAHPTHFERTLAGFDARTLARIRGLRANASRRSHAELDSAPDLDIGNPAELAAEYASLRRTLPGLSVVGGCCGTDHRHVAAIARAFSQSGRWAA